MIAKQFFRPAEISLNSLYLGHNQIMNATREVFGNMPHLQWLDLSRNEIYEMDFDMFRNTKKLQVGPFNTFIDLLLIALCLFHYLNSVCGFRYWMFHTIGLPICQMTFLDSLAT